MQRLSLKKQRRLILGASLGLALLLVAGALAFGSWDRYLSTAVTGRSDAGRMKNICALRQAIADQGSIPTFRNLPQMMVLLAQACTRDWSILDATPPPLYQPLPECYRLPSQRISCYDLRCTTGPCQYQ